MNDNVLIGHYAKNIYYSGYDNELYELTNDNFYDIVGFAPKECPFKKDDEPDKYFDWKKSNLPIFYFTFNKRRPNPETNEVFATGYAVVDIDGRPGVKYVSNHPSVCYTNYTGNGTHIFIHTHKLCSCKNYQEWQDTYNTIAYEIWMELCEKYKDDIKFDSHSSLYYQGCYLWNTEWESNPDYDRDWEPENTRYFDADSGVIHEMYGGKYTRAEAGTYTSYSKKRSKKEDFIDNGNVISQIAENGKRLSDRMVKDFKELDYLEFLEKYEEKYTIITGSETNFENYTDYEGNVYEMYKTNGKHVKLWQPYMQGRDSNGRLINTFEKGRRRKSLASHLKQLCQFTADDLDPDYILYDAVHWIYFYCEDGARFPKTEIISTVVGMMRSYDKYESTLYTDPRMFITGKMKADPDSGEMHYMNTGEKIGANAKCRKTERIKIVINNWDPSKSVEDNIEHIHTLDYEYYLHVDKLSEKTIKSYITAAKKMPELVSKHEWLAEFNNKPQTKQEAGSKGGKKSKSIVVLHIETRETMEFESHQKCMEHFGIKSRKTFSKFIKGCTKYNKTYQVVKDSIH